MIEDGGIMIPCLWPGCGGWIKGEGNCGKCGRSDDLEYEKQVRTKQRIYGLTDANHGSHFERGISSFNRPNYKRKVHNPKNKL